MLYVWLSPIIVFLFLCATRVVPALVAALLALILSAVVVIAAGPVTVTAFAFIEMFIAGAWIALPAVLVILAGLYFTEVLATANTGSIKSAVAPSVAARDLGTTCLFVGPFVETATGFGVGYVVAVSVVMRAGFGPAAALGLGAFSQCLVPWGALGIGTKISAALIAMPVEDVTWRVAIVMMPVLWIMVFFYWRIARLAGVDFSLAQRIEDFATIVVLSVLLIFTSKFLPIELAGMTAIAPVLLYRLWRSAGLQLFSIKAIHNVIPYLLLFTLLAATKLVPDIKAYLSTPAWTPGQGAPLFAPLASPGIALIAAAVLSCLMLGQWRGLSSSIAPTLNKGLRASVLTVLLVALAWIIVRSGIAEAFASAIRDSMDDFAVLVVPILGALGGYLTGSNTGAGSLSMPVAQSVSQSRGVLAWIAAASIMTGSLLTMLSPVRFAMGQAISGASDREAASVFRSLLPFASMIIAISVIATLCAEILSR